MSELEVDARGHRCPVPSLRLRKVMLAQPQGTVIVLLATDPMARIDVPFLMQETGGKVLDIDESEGVLRIRVETGSGAEAGTRA